MTTTHIQWLKKIKVSNPVVIIGLPGIGLIGKITVDYLLTQLKTEKVGEIFSDSFPPSVLTRQGTLELLKNELHVHHGKDQDFLFLVGLQPVLDRSVSNDQHYAFSRTLVEQFKKLKVRELYTIAGLDIGEERIDHEPGIVVAATSRKMSEAFKKLGCHQASDGLITGAAGLLLGVGRQEGLDGACIMGQTSMRLVVGDHQAAKKVVELLIKKFGFKISTKGIEKEAKQVEKGFSELQHQLRQEREAQAVSEEPGEEFRKYTR